MPGMRGAAASASPGRKIVRSGGALTTPSLGSLRSSLREARSRVPPQFGRCPCPGRGHRHRRHPRSPGRRRRRCGVLPPGARPPPGAAHRSGTDAHQPRHRRPSPPPGNHRRVVRRAPGIAAADVARTNARTTSRAVRKPLIRLPLPGLCGITTQARWHRRTGNGATAGGSVLDHNRPPSYRSCQPGVPKFHQGGRPMAGWERFMMSLASVTMIVAANAGDTACQGTGMSYGSPCQLDTRGIRVEQGQVIDVVTVRCHPPPGAFRAPVRLEYSDSGAEPWDPLHPPRVLRTVPDAECYSARVTGGACKPGYWRTAWRLRGVDDAGHEFDEGWDHGQGATQLTEEDSWGWT